MTRWGALLALILWASVAQGTTQTINTIPSSGASFLTTLQAFLRDEDADRYSLLFQPVVVSGCTHATGAGLTKSISSCVAFPAGYYTSASGSVTYNDDDACWLGISADTTPSTVDNYVRQGATNFLVDCDTISAPNSTGVMNVAYVITASGAVSSITQVASVSPFGDVEASTGLVVNASGDIDSVTQTNGQLLIGKTGFAPVAATLTAGTGITVTNGAGTISVATGQDISTTASPTFSRVTSTISSGTAPFTVTSQTKVANLNVEYVDGGDWASPAAIGTTAPNTAIFTTLKVPSSSGSAVAGIYKGTATIDFGNTSDGDCTSPSSITVTGATAGEAVFIGAPTAAQGTGRFWVGYVSASNTVSASFCNMSGSSVDPASGTYTAWVIQ